MFLSDPGCAMIFSFKLVGVKGFEPLMKYEKYLKTLDTSPYRHSLGLYTYSDILQNS